MSGSRSLTATDGSEYELIEATMAESSRGRWFLQEYARRNRSADTEMLLGAIERLEGVVTAEKRPRRKPTRRPDARRRDGHGPGDRPHQGRDRRDQRARTPTRAGSASRPTALDAIVRATERATSDILEAAEHVQEAAWTLRESGSDTAICDELDHTATQVYTACSFQDLTAQRTARIIHTLRYLEERLGVDDGDLGRRADGSRRPVPGGRPAGLAPVDLCQSDVDRFIGMEVPAATRGGPARRPPGKAAAPRRHRVPARLGRGGKRDDRGSRGGKRVRRHGCHTRRAQPQRGMGPSSRPHPPWNPGLPALSFAAIDALPPEQRLALFA